jgi:3D (Asp-Asp-Asp) domain-containing protein
MNLVLITILIGNMTITSYRSIPRQTDSSPWITSIGERVHPHGIAVSPDLLKKHGGPLNYGDVVFVEGYGFKIVNDVMHKSKRQSIDIWVATYAEEKSIGVTGGRIWLVIPTLKEKNIWKEPTSWKSFIVNIVSALRLLLLKAM